MNWSWQRVVVTLALLGSGLGCIVLHESTIAATLFGAATMSVIPPMRLNGNGPTKRLNGNIPTKS